MAPEDASGCPGEAVEAATLGLELPHGVSCSVHCAAAHAATFAKTGADEHGEACEQVASTLLAVNIEPHAEVLAWLGKSLRQTFDSSAAEALLMCVEVILADDETPIDEVLFQATSILADEGAPHELVESLCNRWHAACEAAKSAPHRLDEAP